MIRRVATRTLRGISRGAVNRHFPITSTETFGWQPQHLANFSTTRRQQQGLSSTIPALRSRLTDAPTSDQDDQGAAKSSENDEVPAYQITFTCKPCLTRASHRISKQGYHHGSVLIQCPNCKARHVISDHLKIFSDTARSLEDILRETNEVVRSASLSAEGDVEFWHEGGESKEEDGTKSS